MELTQEQLNTLRSYKNTTDDDNIRHKEIIKSNLINDPLIIYLLNNKELEECNADPSDYLGINILPYYMIHAAQSNSQNYICYDISFKETFRYNELIKYQQIYFYILCEQMNGIEKKTGIARHDLIAARVRDIFNWTNKFGPQCHIVSDMPGVTDNDYNTRTLVFELNVPNNLAKTRNGKSKIVNYDVVT